MNGFRVLKEIFKHQSNLAWVNKLSVLNSLIFYFICLSLFNIAIGPYQLAESVRIALLFTPLVLAMLLNCDTLVQDDYKDGILQQHLLIPAAYEFILLGKLLSYISTYILSLVIIFPVACFILDIDLSLAPYLISIGSVLVIFISSVLLLSTAMTISNNFNILLPILVLPLIIPALILATLAYQNSIYFWLLFACTLIVLPVFLFFSRYLLEHLIKYD